MAVLVGGTVVQLLTYTVDSTAGGTVVMVITSRVVLGASVVGGTGEVSVGIIVSVSMELEVVSTKVLVCKESEVLGASVEGGVREVLVGTIVSVSMELEIVSTEVLVCKEYTVVTLVTYCVVVVVMVLLSEQAGTLFANADGTIERAKTAKHIFFRGKRR